MDSLGDYIYLIIIALAGLSSFFKKRKKEAEATQMPDDEEPDFREILGQPKPEKDWWEDETVYSPAAPVVQEVQTPVYSQEKITLETSESYENTRDVQKLRIRKTIQESGLKTNSTKTVLETESDENPFLNNIRLNDVDDARRAFIYTEIFNRKY